MKKKMLILFLLYKYFMSPTLLPEEIINSIQLLSVLYHANAQIAIGIVLYILYKRRVREYNFHSSVFNLTFSYLTDLSQDVYISLRNYCGVGPESN